MTRIFMAYLDNLYGTALIGEDTTQATPLELDEIRPRYGIALLKALVKFIQDGIDIEVAFPACQKTQLFELEKLVFYSRGQVGIWLPSNRVETLRNFGSKIHKERQKSPKITARGLESSLRIR